MDRADVPIVYFNPEVLVHKKLPMIKLEEIKEAFNNDRLQIFTDPIKLYNFLVSQSWNKSNLLLMSSGNFGGLNYQDLAKIILKN